MSQPGVVLRSYVRLRSAIVGLIAGGTSRGDSRHRPADSAGGQRRNGQRARSSMRLVAGLRRLARTAEFYLDHAAVTFEWLLVGTFHSACRVWAAIAAAFGFVLLWPATRALSAIAAFSAAFTVRASKATWRTLGPVVKALYRSLRRGHSHLRTYRFGRYASNIVGAASTMMATFRIGRGVYLGGPIVGAALAAPLRYAWLAIGLHDMRIFLLFLVGVLGGLLKVYERLGFFD